MRQFLVLSSSPQSGSLFAAHQHSTAPKSMPHKLNWFLKAHTQHIHTHTPAHTHIVTAAGSNRFRLTLRQLCQIKCQSNSWTCPLQSKLDVATLAKKRWAVRNAVNPSTPPLLSHCTHTHRIKIKSLSLHCDSSQSGLKGRERGAEQEMRMRITLSIFSCLADVRFN